MVDSGMGNLWGGIGGFSLQQTWRRNGRIIIGVAL